MTNASAKNNESNNTAEIGVKLFKESVVIMDDNTWLWGLVERTLNSMNTSFVKFASSMTIRQSWNRFHDTPFMVIHWESKFRGGGALI